ncbi:MAG: serine/threonine-protein kinase [Cyanobacteria bacterium J06632_3]
MNSSTLHINAADSNAADSKASGSKGQRPSGLSKVSAVESASHLAQNKPLFRGQFSILRRLGRGGFGTAYLAQDVTVGQRCVVKQIRYRTKKSSIAANASLEKERNQRRFQKEARMMARLGRHQQIPCLLDHFVEKGQFYLVQEYIPGKTLSQEFHKSGIQSEAQVKDFLREMIPIIRYVHRHNLLHLDIKPSNIIRRSHDQKLVLIDFGAVRRFSKEASADNPDRCTGTVGFSPSEQLTGHPTPASDIYALGVTCLYLLTGCSPMDFATSPKGQNLRWQESVQVSAHFDQILKRMLAPEASHRFQSIEALERALKLETHYDELSACMTREDFLQQREQQSYQQPEACLLDNYVDAGAQSSAARQASSIRRWQQRRRQFKSFTPK